MENKDLLAKITREKARAEIQATKSLVDAVKSMTEMTRLATEKTSKSMVEIRGDAFKYEDFTKDQLEGLRGFKGETGPKGDAFMYKDFTYSQLELLRGPQGRPGERGLTGDKGKALQWSDLTVMQRESLRGERGAIGAMPKHEWKDTSIRFEHASGVWGSWHDLKGESGVTTVKTVEGEFQPRTNGYRRLSDMIDVDLTGLTINTRGEYVLGSGGGGGGAVSSVFGRIGAVLAQSGDYTTTQVTEGTNLYYTQARFDSAIAAIKGLTNGLASLDGTGKVPISQLPALALTDVYTVGSQAAQLALTVEEGDIAIRTDLSKTYVQNGGVSGTMADWSELLSPTGYVTSVSGTLNRITSTGGPTPAIDIASTYVGQASITTVGTIENGTWNGNTIGVQLGGTGFAFYTTGDMIYASAFNALAKLSAVAVGNSLISGGVGTAPSWGKIGLTTHVTGTLPVANGGTGLTSALTSGSVLFSNGATIAEDNTNFFWDNTNKRLALGANTADARLKIVGTDVATSGIFAVRVSTNVNPVTYRHYKARGTVGAETTVVAGDEVSRFETYGWGTAYQLVGVTTFLASTVAGSAIGGSWRLSLADSAGTSTTRMTVDANGNVGVGVVPTTSDGRFRLGGNVSSAGRSNIGAYFTMDNTNTATDTTSTGTVSIASGMALFGTRFASTLATTYTETATLWIAGAPTASTNVTITSAWALYVNAGNSKFGGGVTMSSYLQFGTSNQTIFDSNGNEYLKFATTASAVNEFTLTNGATGIGPTLSATGNDTDIDFNLLAKGLGKVYVEGTSTSFVTVNNGGIFSVGTPLKNSTYRSRILFGIDNTNNASYGSAFIQGREVQQGVNMNLHLNPYGGGVVINGNTTLAAIPESPVLIVANPSSNGYIRLQNTSSYGGGATPYTGLLFQQSAGSGHTYIKAGVIFNGYDVSGYCRGQLLFALDPTASGVNVQDTLSTSTRMNIDYVAGNVAIGQGVTVGNSRLQVTGSQSGSVRAITALRTLDDTDFAIVITANSFTVTLPTAVGITGRIYYIKNRGAGTTTLATTSSQTIDGTTPGTLTNNQAITLMSDGANWIIL